MKPIIGFREWKVVDLDGNHGEPNLRLGPRYGNMADLRGPNIWTNPRAPAEALCSTRGKFAHPAGSKGCGCGVYGFYQPMPQYAKPILEHVDEDSIPEEPFERIMAMDNENVVYGVYVGWGKTTRCSRGFRCQYAKVLALRWSPLAEEIAQLYELTVCDTVGELKAAGMRYGELLEEEPDTGGLGGWGTGGGGGLWGFISPPPVPRSAYRSPVQQAAMYAQYLTKGGYCGPMLPRRHIVKLVLNSGVELVEERGIHKPSAITVKGLDQELWTIVEASVAYDRIDVPMPGVYQNGIKPGHRTVTLKLEAIFAAGERQAALEGLGKLGAIEVVHESPVI